MSNVVLSSMGLGSKAIRMNEEVERLLRMTAWLRECLEADLASALGTATKKGVDSKTMTQWKELCATFKQLAEAKVLLDKNAKVLADAMSPEDELAAVESFIRAMEPKAADKFLQRQMEWRTANG